MGILGGSRIDNLTITVVITIITYTILVGGVLATFTDAGFTNPYGSANVDLNLGKTFQSSEMQNVTKQGLLDETHFEEIEPTRVFWWYGVLGWDGVRIGSFGHNLWDGWFSFKLEPTEGITEDEILDVVDDEGLVSEFVFHQGRDLETWVYFYPKLYYDDVSETVTYLYVDLATSIDNDEMTIVIATNATYNEYDVGQIFGMIAGFDTTYYPSEIAILISGIWWGLLILTAVKLVVG